MYDLVERAELHGDAPIRVLERNKIILREHGEPYNARWLLKCQLRPGIVVDVAISTTRIRKIRYIAGMGWDGRRGRERTSAVRERTFRVLRKPRFASRQPSHLHTEG